MGTGKVYYYLLFLAFLGESFGLDAADASGSFDVGSFRFLGDSSGSFGVVNLRVLDDADASDDDGRFLDDADASELDSFPLDSFPLGDALDAFSLDALGLGSFPLDDEGDACLFLSESFKCSIPSHLSAILRTADSYSGSLRVSMR